tara:strand:- start:526 stop:795 length:270 start_codon:yes stop_codon:yes gene_type:complete
MMHELETRQETIDRVLHEVGIFIGGGCTFDDWITVKKHALRCLPSKLRRHFSTRCPKTKVQRLNSFEKQLIISLEDRFNIILERPGDYG